MCDPASAIAVAAMALSASSTYVQYQEQNEQANQMNAYQNALRAQNITNAKEAYVADNRLLNERLTQEQEAAADEILKQKIEATKLSGKATAAAGEANVSGLSLDRLLSGIERDSLFNQGTIKRNLQNTTNQLESERELLKANFQSNANSVSPGMYAGPSALSAGLAIGGTVLDGINSSQALQDKMFGQKSGGKTGGSKSGN